MKITNRIFMIILLTAVICLCGYKLWEMSERYVHEEQINKKIASYRPPDIQQTKKTSEEESDETISEEPEEPDKNLPGLQPNKFVTDLRNEVNSDIVGWIRIPGTRIDYPFVQARDNNYYLRRDVFGGYALAGTIFMDYRCPKDFTGFNTIIYGHNMNNGSMFGDLCLFDDEGFFEDNRFGTIFLEDKTYKLEFFACMIVKEDDVIIYNPYATPENSDEFLEYVKRFARNYREPETENTENIATLSTCSYDGSVRIVLLANITNSYIS